MKKNLFKNIFLLLSVIFMTSCGIRVNCEDIGGKLSDYAPNQVETIKTMYTQSENDYGFYLYSEECGGCKEAKKCMVNYQEDYKNGEVFFKIYTYDALRLRPEGVEFKTNPEGLSPTEIKNEMVRKGVGEVKDTYFAYFPSLFVISDGKIVDYYAGPVDVVNFLYLENNLDSRSYQELDQFKLNDLSNFYNQKEDEYYIYLYYQTCPSCKAVKRNVFDYLFNKNEIPLYHYDMKVATSDEGATNRAKFAPPPKNVETIEEFKRVYISENIKNKVSSTSQTYYFYVPSIYIVKNNVLSNVAIGELEITKLLR